MARINQPRPTVNPARRAEAPPKTGVFTSPARTNGSSAPQSAIVERKPMNPQVSEKTIAEAAYFLWKERGGDSTLNWLEAERRLRTASHS